MSFTLGQYDYNGEENTWLTPLSSDITPVTILTKKETATSTELNFENCFRDIGFKRTKTFEQVAYYCQVAIKKTYLLSQSYEIKLVNSKLEKNSYSVLDQVDIQQINLITINATDQEEKNEWDFIDFIFYPYMDTYDTIYFDMVRIGQDYIDENNGRIPEIVMLELSKIENLKANNKTSMPKNPFLKIGVQSAPGLRMVLNNEEIYVGRTGIYEFKHTDIKIEQIGMITQAQSWEGNKSVKFQDIKDILNNNYNIEYLYTKGQGKYEYYINPNSPYHYFKIVKSERNFQPFTLDYIYEYKTNTTTE